MVCGAFVEVEARNEERLLGRRGVVGRGGGVRDRFLERVREVDMLGVVLGDGGVWFVWCSAVLRSVS